MSGDRANAEDIVQTAIEKILKNYPDLNDNTEFSKLVIELLEIYLLILKEKNKASF